MLVILLCVEKQTIWQFFLLNTLTHMMTVHLSLCPGGWESCYHDAKAGLWRHHNQFWIFVLPGMKKIKLITQTLVILEYSMKWFGMCLCHRNHVLEAVGRTVGISLRLRVK